MPSLISWPTVQPRGEQRGKGLRLTSMHRRTPCLAWAKGSTPSDKWLLYITPTRRSLGTLGEFEQQDRTVYTNRAMTLLATNPTCRRFGGRRPPTVRPSLGRCRHITMAHRNCQAAIGRITRIGDTSFATSAQIWYTLEQDQPICCIPDTSRNNPTADRSGSPDRASRAS